MRSDEEYIEQSTRRINQDQDTPLVDKWYQFKSPICHFVLELLHSQAWVFISPPRLSDCSTPSAFYG